MKKVKKITLIGTVILSLFTIIWTTSASVNLKYVPILSNDVLRVKIPAPLDTIDDDTLKFPIRDNSYNPLDNQKYNSSLYLKQPSIFSNNIEYDPVTGQFIVTEQVGDMNLNTPYTMDFDEYNKYQSQSEIRSYWKDKLEYQTGSKKTGNPLLNKFVNPKFNVNFKGFEDIFGSDEIAIVPTGAANLSFGLTYYNIDDPSLSKRARRGVNFKFDENIQIGVTGKIGDKMNVGINYNTEATFSFENKTKIEYVGEEDEIIQRIEAGNVTMPLENTLIPGSSTLFGLKTEMKFGRLYITSVASQQKGESETIEVDGGAVLNDFEISASDYDEDKHFFLNHYFRENFEASLANLPAVISSAKITRIEIWVTNKSSDYDDARNVAAFLDLAEDNRIYSDHVIAGNTRYPNNESNSLYNEVSNISGIRDITQVSNLLQANYRDGVDFVKLENARKLTDRDFTYNDALGFISLNFSLRDGEVLAVAYEYTMAGEVYQVGEFSNGDVQAPNTLILKLLKGPALTPALPNWDLMMKNIYSLNAYSLSNDDFSMEIFYNNDQTGTPVNYISEGEIKDKRLLTVFNLDNTDKQNTGGPDGFFDFIPNITIIPRNGKIIFPMLEPFGNYLEKKIDDPTTADRYSFQELYDSTKYKAKQVASKNKFYLKGNYRSSSGSEIRLNAMNIPDGAVKVVQGGVELTEGADFTVDYNMGTVTILNESLLASGTPIKITVESEDMFGMKTKNLVGSHFNYQFNDNFNIGSTVMHLTERPMDKKMNIGEEPISNTIWGLNTSYSTEVPLFTKMVDLLPLIETKEPSFIDYSGEFAQLIPGNPRVTDKDGISYIDDFEDSQTYIDLRAPQAWVIASTPQYQTSMFPEADKISDVSYGYNRANFAWYNVSEDLNFDKSVTRPAHLTDDDISNHYVRTIMEKEIFPNKETSYGLPARLNIFNIAYYPSERGPYNFDVEGEAGISAGLDSEGNLNAPSSRWGGIMRDLYINDFESSNIEFIEFWVMDPFVYDSTSTGGSLYFNLGNISEDILHDNEKSFENGIPYPDDNSKLDTTQWGVVSRMQMLTPTFDTDIDAKRRQDAGYDGLLDDGENEIFIDYIERLAQKYTTGSAVYNKIIADPSNDNFIFYLNDEYDENKTSILDRYKKYNNTQGNALPSEGSGSASAVTLLPDMEDVNDDQTLDTYEGYYQYKVEIRPEDMVVGQNYIVNKIEADVKNLANKVDGQTVTWYQFKIPIYEPDRVLGNIDGFQSIRFMRIFMNDFEQEQILRFAKLQLVRGDWRKYQNTISEGGEGGIYPQPDNLGNLDVSVVNIEESASKTPVNYVLPPEIARDQNLMQTQAPMPLNEQAISLKTNDLPDGVSKSIYKTVNMDFRKYKKLRMFVHAEALPDMQNQLDDGDLSLFVRLGSDFTQNYYEYEIPLSLTPEGHYTYSESDLEDPVRYIVWPTSNELNLEFEKLQAAKQQRNNNMREVNTTVSLTTPYVVYDDNLERKITILGNPNLSNVKTIMIGIRNPKQENNVRSDDGQVKSGEVWINELRLTDFNDDGGWAANSRISTNFADLASFTASGYMHTVGYGSIEKKVNERYKDETREYDLTSQIEFGKFFNKDYGVSIPVYAGFSESFSDPEYNPLDPDIKLRTTLEDQSIPQAERDEIRDISQTYVRRRSINLTNVRVQGKKPDSKGKGRKKKARVKMPYHISNFSTSLAYSEIYTRTPVIEFDTVQNLTSSFHYNYSPSTKPIEPFRKMKIFKPKPLQIIKDFNFYYMPSRINFSTEFSRQYSTFKNRDVNKAGLDLPASVQKNFLWQRNYDISYKLSKSIQLDFNAVNAARVETDGWRERETFFEQQGWQTPQDTIFKNFFDLGENTDYNHQVKLNWKVPVNKLPLLRWTSLTANYTGTYDWRVGEGEREIMATDSTPAYNINFGNSIQNSGTVRLNGRLNFSKLYSSVKYLKAVDKRFTKKGRKPIKKKPKPVNFEKDKISLRKGQAKYITHKLKTEDIKKVVFTDASGKKVPGKYEVFGNNKIKFTSDTTMKNVKVKINGTKAQKENALIIASDYTLKSMMALQSVSINYTESFGTLLNGYMPRTQYMGMRNYNGVLAPGWEFITGIQDQRIAHTATGYGWLTTDSLFNEAINLTNANEWRIKANLKPLNNVKIDLNFQRSIAFNQQQYGYAQTNGEFFEDMKMINGNYNISFNTLSTAFNKIDSSYSSNGYENFRLYREQIALRLANNRKNLDPNYQGTMYVDSAGVEYPDGYSGTSQEVLIPAFLAAYSGLDPSKISMATFMRIPLPDWRVTFDGLSNLPFIKDFVKKATIKHGYQSTYTINDFQSNISFDNSTFEQSGYSSERYQSDLFIPQYEIGGVMLSEKFMPLFGIDITWEGTFSSRFEFQKSRELFLSFSNNQIREHHTRAFTFGGGYTFKELPINNIRINGESHNLKSDLNLRLDLTIRKDFEIFHRLQENMNELNIERRDFTLTSTADYNINDKVDIQLFYNHTVQITNTTPRNTNIEAGFKVRFSLTQ